MADSSQKPAPRKRQKPAPTPPADFPLWIHKGTQRWCKKIRQRLVYFGYVADDPKGELALNAYLDQRDDLLAGRVPREKDDGLRLVDLCNHFLNYKAELVKSKELSQRTYDGYKAVLEQICDYVGKYRSADDIQPDDFATIRAKLSDRYGPVSLTNRIQVVRSLFKYSYEAGLIEKPARFGVFKKPRAKVIRESRLAKGAQDFTAEEIRKLLAVATVNMKGMILLGVQAGFGNADCAELVESAINFETGWIEWPRSKTATHRRIPLWNETMVALRAAIAQKTEASPLVFVGRRGVDYTCDDGGYRVAKEFARAVRDAGVAKKGFYCLRRTFQTQGEEARDLVAVQKIMGHIPNENDMSARYRQRVSDERLRAVVDHVHGWLFSSKDGAK